MQINNAFFPFDTKSNKAFLVIIRAIHEKYLRTEHVLVHGKSRTNKDKKSKERTTQQVMKEEKTIFVIYLPCTGGIFIRLCMLSATLTCSLPLFMTK